MSQRGPFGVGEFPRDDKAPAGTVCLFQHIILHIITRSRSPTQASMLSRPAQAWVQPATSLIAQLAGRRSAWRGGRQPRAGNEAVSWNGKGIGFQRIKLGIVQASIAAWPARTVRIPCSVGFPCGVIWGACSGAFELRLKGNPGCAVFRTVQRVSASRKAVDRSGRDFVDAKCAA